MSNPKITKIIPYAFITLIVLSSIGLVAIVIKKSFSDVDKRTVADNNSNSFANEYKPNAITSQKPEILKPSTAPQQGSYLDITFKDIGVSTYEISYILCIYENDRIGLCRNGTEYKITKTNDDVWIFEYGNEVKSAHILEKDGIIQLTDTLSELYYEGSIQYTVKALSKDNTDNTVTNAATKLFTIIQ